MLTNQNLTSAKQTAREMARLATAFQDDVLPWATLSLEQFFRHLAGIPYRPDPQGIEFCQRPYYTLSGTGGGGDCDDKAIAAAAYAILRKIPWRFVAVGKTASGDLHHVFAEFMVGGVWIPFDVTYSFNVLGAPRPWAKREVLYAPTGNASGL